LELGLMLVLVGAVLAATEVHVPSHGVLGGGAVAALATGVALLVAGSGSTAIVAILVGLLVALAGGTALWSVMRTGLATRRLRAKNSLIGRIGVARDENCVFVDGALWRARSWGLEDEPPLSRGLPVVVEGVNGLTLTVRPAEEWEVAP
jgi:membrane-bound ClpP family serine protease